MFMFILGAPEKTGMMPMRFMLDDAWMSLLQIITMMTMLIVKFRGVIEMMMKTVMFTMMTIKAY